MPGKILLLRHKARIIPAIFVVALCHCEGKKEMLPYSLAKVVYIRSTESDAMERYEFFKGFHDISMADYQLLTDSLKPRSFKKNDFITVPGQIQRDLYFVKSGVQMSYFDTGDKIYTLAFTHFPYLCAIAESFSFQVPSKYHLVCLTDSELEYISYNELQLLVNQSQQIERLFRRMTEAMLAGMIDLHIELRAMTIEDRYKTFCRKNPDLLRLVPHKYIASYLGIDPTNFSKLFNNVMF